MITQIEIDGFKTFKDFKVDLAPFQVIVGPNGSGKSNLFDALQLLSHLADADTDLQTAFQGLRGDALDLFTKFPDGQTSKQIRIAVEMLVDRKVRDDLGKQAELKYTRLRYELELALRPDKLGWEALRVMYESLEAISEDEDNWCKKYGLSSQNSRLPKSAGDRISFISTDASTQTGTPAIYLYVEEHPYEHRGTIEFQPEAIERPVLSSVTTTIGYPHAFAVREELRSLRFLHLDPKALRQPSPTKSPRYLSPDGSNLPTMLARIQAEDKLALGDISRDMANLISGILKIKVEQDKPSDRYVIYAETADRRSFSSQVLSDGTLRLLALATLRNDPQFHGILCLEEPENGVDPLHLAKMARLLCDMATDFKDTEQVNKPLRQVLVTTHSPTLISQPDIIDSLLLAIIPTRVQGKNAPSIRVTRLVPVITSNTQFSHDVDATRDRAVEAYTIDQVRKYLDGDTLEKARNQLSKARTNLSKR